MSKRVGRVVVGLLSLGFAATAQPSVATGEQRYVWQKQNVAQLPLDADGDTVFFTRTRMCAQSYRRLRLVCWDTKTGAEALRYERDLPAGSKPTSLLYQLQGAWVTLAYQAGNKVFVRRVELDKGAEQRAFEFTLSDSPNPVARTFGISGSSFVKDGHLVYFHDFGLREGSWGVPVFHGGRAYINHRDLIVGLDLTTRQIVMRARVPGRGLLTLGPDDASLLFVDDKSARLISFEGRSLAQSPQLAGGLDDNPVVIEPDAIFLCGQYKLQTHALDRKTLKPRWTFTNKNGPGGGQSLCPSLFSANQVATLDAKRTVILDRKNGKVLFDQLGALPNSRYMAADANGFCFHIRKGSACLDR